MTNWTVEANLPPTVDIIENALLGEEDKDDALYAEFRDELRKKFAAAKRRPQRPEKPAELDLKSIEDSGNAKATALEAIQHRTQPRNLPYPSLGNLFKGRRDTLEQIHAELFSPEDGSQSVVTCAICGLGGVGKTRIAIEYAFRYREKYSALFFLRADSPSNLRSDFVALASPQNLDLPEAGATNDDIKISAVLKWLDIHPTWFLIFDNVDDAEAVNAAQGWLAKLNGGHVLLNGRMTNLPASIQKLDELGPLDQAAASEFMFMRTNEDRARRGDDSTQASALVNELGALALGLEQAGAYIATERISFSRYLELWREKRKIVIEWFDRKLMAYDHETGLAATWATSFDRLSPESRWLLERLSYFGPDPVPDSIFDIFNDDDGPSVVMQAAKSGLFSYSLISRACIKERSGSWDGFTLHRLVQDFTRRNMSAADVEEAIFQSASWILNAYSGDPSDTLTWPALEPLVPHMLALTSFENKRSLELIGLLHQRLGAFFRAKGRHSEAGPALRRSMEIIRDVYAAEPTLVAAAIGNLAEFQFVMNRFDEAENLYKESLAFLDLIKVEDDPEGFVSLMNNYSELLRRTYRKDEAAHIVHRSYIIANKYLAKDNPKLIRTMISLSSLFSQMGRLEEAEQLNRRAVALSALHGKLQQDYARSLFELANLLKKKGQENLHEAEVCYLAAIRIAVDCYSENHPLVAIITQQYVGLLCDTDRREAAEPLMHGAVSIFAAHFPADHPNVTGALDTLQSLRDLKER